MEKASFALCLMVLLVVIPQSTSPLQPNQTTEAGGRELDPFQTGVARITALEGDRLEGNVTAEKLPVRIYIHKDGGEMDISDFEVEDAMYYRFGMIGKFDFVSAEDTDWILIFINDNNLTQWVDYHCAIHPSPSRALIQAAPVITLMAIPLLIIIGPIIYLERKKA